MARGWISLHRQICEWKHYPLEEKRAFTKYEAWIDLLLMANHKRGVVGRVVIERGQILTSQIGLAERWRWSRCKVQDYLKDLSTPLVGPNYEIAPEIDTKIDTQKTMITIREYDTYQLAPEKKGMKIGSESAANRQRIGTNNKVNKKKNEKKEEVMAGPMKSKPVKTGVAGFEDWVRENWDKALSMAKSIREDPSGPGLILPENLKWLKQELGRMRAWLIGNPEKANKKRWGRFINNWLGKPESQKVSHDWRPYPNYLTPGEEDAHYATKRRSGSGTDFSPIGGDLP